MISVRQAIFTFVALTCIGAGPSLAQPAPTLGVSIGVQGYKAVKQPQGGLTAEVTGGIEWIGRTRIEIGTTATVEPTDCPLASDCGAWQVESIAAFGEISRLLGERGAPLRFVLAARAGHERLLTWDRDGFAAAGRMGGEFRLGGRTALSVIGFAGWATFEDPNSFSSGTDFTGLRLGMNIGIRIYPGGTSQ